MWSYDLGDGCPEVCGWGNNELQSYTNTQRNARVENGRLIIEAHQEEIDSSTFSSARLVSKGKGDWKYGRIEIKAMLPQGKGTWPAIWMLPTLDQAMKWPDDGEIDIMEHVGFNQGTVYGTVHTGAYNWMKGTQKIDSVKVGGVSDQFHIYTIEWNKKSIKWFIDYHLYHEVMNENKGKDAWPFDKPFHLILNIAVGGNWGGKYGVDDEIWPQRMEVEYVRVYQDTSP